MIDIERTIEHLGIEVRFHEDMTEAAGTKKIPSGYLVMLNPRLNKDAQMAALEHEIDHIILGHFDDRKHLTEKEKEAEADAEWDWPSQR